MDVIELFAGVGGFRMGLEEASSEYHIIWSNQWEPGSKTQEASEIYKRNFHTTEIEHSNVDINKVSISDIPPCDMLVGGFPCQDYSVAGSLKTLGGIEGKKGVLWWNIEKILREHPSRIKYVFLENVDRLLLSPAKQRGRDFAIMLNTLAKLDFAVEWRVIDSAKYGFSQRRKRTYILAYRKGTNINSYLHDMLNAYEWIMVDSPLALSFPVKKKELGIFGFPTFSIDESVKEISDNFNKKKEFGDVPFKNAGFMIDYQVFTMDVDVDDSSIEKHTLGDVLQSVNDIPADFYIDDLDIDKWLRAKGGKKVNRVSKDGYPYVFSEGAIPFPDSLDKPARTIITGEGGSSPTRFKHVIKDSSGRTRRLTPIELERLDGFPDDWTYGASNQKRAFLMGNALVVGVIKKIGEKLIETMNASA